MRTNAASWPASPAELPAKTVDLGLATRSYGFSLLCSCPLGRFKEAVGGILASALPDQQQLIAIGLL